MYIQVHIISVCTVYLAEYFTKKREFQQKRIEIQIEYLKKNSTCAVENFKYS